MASSITTIPVERSVVKELKEVKQYPRQTYSELLLEMTKVFKLLKPQKTQYDEFLQKQVFGLARKRAEEELKGEKNPLKLYGYKRLLEVGDDADELFEY